MRGARAPTSIKKTAHRQPRTGLPLTSQDANPCSMIPYKKGVQKRRGNLVVGYQTHLPEVLGVAVDELDAGLLELEGDDRSVWTCWPSGEPTTRAPKWVNNSCLNARADDSLFARAVLHTEIIFMYKM